MTKMMRKIACLLMMVFLALSAFPQTISVSNFQLLETDLTANLHGTTVLDQNGEKCALIKIITNQTGFSFDVGMLGVMKTEQKLGEIWVYVPFGVKRIKLSHAIFEQFEYVFPIPIEKARTYAMKLVSGKVNTLVEYELKKQNLIFKITTADGSSVEDATLFVNEKIWPISYGNASKLLEYGSYSYRVSKPLYHDVAGIFQLSKDNNRVEITTVQIKFDKRSLK